jgi:DUF1680 family protein
VTIRVNPEKPTTFTLYLRIPVWCQKAEIAVNGDRVDVGQITGKGYATITREWGSGDKVWLDLDMPVERIVANPAVRMANGKVALQRGPVVYCLEEVDNRIAPLNRIALPRTSQLNTRYEKDLLGGVVVITGEAEVIEGEGWNDVLYRNQPVTARRCEIMAVPYCIWDNREPGQMLVWIRESA